jgi:ribosome-associated protein
MDDMLLVAKKLATLIQEYQGIDVVILDLRDFHAYTDFFVIATVNRIMQVSALERHIRDFCKENNLDIVQKSHKPAHTSTTTNDEWRVIDLGAVVIHLMTAQSRSFYDLERLWGSTPMTKELVQPV